MSSDLDKFLNTRIEHGGPARCCCGFERGLNRTCEASSSRQTVWREETDFPHPFFCFDVARAFAEFGNRGIVGRN